MGRAPFAEPEIARYAGLARPGLDAGIDAVFFGSAAPRTFADEQERARFRERWLGRYLEHHPRWAYVALGPGAGAPVVGYLVGALDDPAPAPLFADLDYFQSWRALTARYPAHLHVNLAPEWRSRGVGTRLLDTFLADARDAGAPGAHVVTGRGLRNVGFYVRNGFRELGALHHEGRELLFLARDLAD